MGNLGTSGQPRRPAVDRESIRSGYLLALGASLTQPLGCLCSTSSCAQPPLLFAEAYPMVASRVDLLETPPRRPRGPARRQSAALRHPALAGLENVPGIRGIRRAWATNARHAELRRLVWKALDGETGGPASAACGKRPGRRHCRFVCPPTREERTWPLSSRWSRSCLVCSKLGPPSPGQGRPRCVPGRRGPGRFAGRGSVLLPPGAGMLGRTTATLRQRTVKTLRAVLAPSPPAHQGTHSEDRLGIERSRDRKHCILHAIGHRGDTSSFLRPN